MVSTTGATFFTERLKQRRDARNLAYAFHGGIGAILTIIEERRYASIVRTLIAHAHCGQQISPLKIRARRDYVELYSKNVDRLGMLHPTIAQRIPVFYTCVSSLLEDVDTMYDGQWDHFEQQQLLASYKEFLGLLEKTINLGNHILAIVEEKYASSLLWMHLPG
ncbi:hypothetical protein [Paraburkholderia atlantica]|uniref:hypothetical protein n=1 Tax=Paraburkholderia atlantica TaxID=2654982 RepID=UPI0012F7F037|nr:hypothetical protein [Paraburkholderia atlantica]